ncbi:hypothetical protein [Neorhizobium sp. T6_25]|jgi:hypothetical protein|uniref:hypothetical protein n=1 Tax=Neorhizobium sp. T6_25 TaxID=2093833 RepID=UPI000CF956AD|nr:hypothetical protein [Neorhizobium sp. T6_25]
MTYFEVGPSQGIKEAMNTLFLKIVSSPSPCQLTKNKFWHPRLQQGASWQNATPAALRSAVSQIAGLNDFDINFNEP